MHTPKLTHSGEDWTVEPLRRLGSSSNPGTIWANDPLVMALNFDYNTTSNQLPWACLIEWLLGRPPVLSKKPNLGYFPMSYQVAGAKNSSPYMWFLLSLGKRKKRRQISNYKIPATLALHVWQVHFLLSMICWHRLVKFEKLLL